MSVKLFYVGKLRNIYLYSMVQWWLGGAELKADDLKGLFQPEPFCDSLIVKNQRPLYK